MHNNMDAQEKFAGLDNVEISMIYYRFSQVLKKIDKNIEQGIITKTVNLPGSGARIEAPLPLNDRMKNDLTDSMFYKTVQSIVNKLEPIVEIIEDYDSSIKEKLS
jgi:hypothetical protein